MKIKSEVKVGLIGIVTLIVLIWGINYLKGRDILAKTYSLHAFYEDSGRLESSAPVVMNGVKIGYIDAIELQPGSPLPIHVILHIDKSYPLHTGSKAILFSADLLGSRAIRLESSGDTDYLTHNDTILTATDPDMFSALVEQVKPVMQQVGELAESLDSMVSELDTLLESGSPQQTMQHLADVSKSLSTSLGPGGSLHESFNNLESFTSMLESQEEEIASMTGHLNSVSEALDSADIGHIAEELAAVSGEFSQLMDQVNSGKGTVGKLFYSDSVYMQLQYLLTDLDSLVNDLQENPQDYVRFSLFGK